MKLWYASIRRTFPKETTRDYELDSRFAGNAARSSADRVKIFEKISRGAVPNLTPSGPTGIDVVAEVDRVLPGTGELLTSEFWELVKRPPGVRETRRRLEAFLQRKQFHRMNVLDFAGRYYAAQSMDLRSYRCRAIELSLSVLGSRLDKLTFLALLVREADFGGNLDVLDLARSFFDERLEYFLMEHGQGQCPEHKLILDRVLLSERQVKKKDMACQHEAQDLSNLVPVPISVGHGQSWSV